jgi:hypothetical protein
MASGYGAPHQQAGHMAAPTRLASPSKKTLTKAEPSTHGTFQSEAHHLATSAVVAKADLSEADLVGRVCPMADPLRHRSNKRATTDRR